MDIAKDNDDYIIDELEYDLCEAVWNIDVSVVCEAIFYYACSNFIVRPSCP